MYPLDVRLVEKELEPVVEGPALALPPSDAALDRQVQMGKQNKRGWKKRFLLVLHDHRETLRLPHVLRNGVHLDEDVAETTNVNMPFDASVAKQSLQDMLLETGCKSVVNSCRRRRPQCIGNFRLLDRRGKLT